MSGWAAPQPPVLWMLSIRKQISLHALNEDTDHAFVHTRRGNNHAPALCTRHPTIFVAPERAVGACSGRICTARIHRRKHRWITITKSSRRKYIADQEFFYITKPSFTSQRYITKSSRRKYIADQDSFQLVSTTNFLHLTALSSCKTYIRNLERLICSWNYFHCDTMEPAIPVPTLLP